MSMDFSGSAGAATPFDLIPAGQLAWAILSVRGVKGSGSGGQYLDCELTLDDGQPYARKKLWTMIGDPNHAGNSEKYREMGMIAITRILECGKGAGPNNRAAYAINAYTDLNGLRVGIKVGVEKGTEGHNDKNKVAEFLTPNPASQSGHKGFVALSAGQHGATEAKPAAPASGFAGFGGAVGGSMAAATTGGFGDASNAGAVATSGFPQAQEAQPVASAEAQPTTSGFATTTNATAASPSDPAATPSWLEQASAAA